MGQSFQPPGAFVKHLERLGFRATRSRERWEAFEIHFLDLSRLLLRTSRFAPFVVAEALSGHGIVLGEEIEELLPKLIEIRRRRAPNFVVLVIGGGVHQLSHELEEELQEHSIAVIDRTVIEEIMEVRSRQLFSEALGRALVRRLGRRALSPYLPGRPVYGGMFFGREQILQRVLAGHGTNFTIYGNRRVGKTSLLREIRHRKHQRDPRTSFVELDGSVFNHPEDFLNKILDDLGAGSGRAHDGDVFDTFVHELQAIPRRKGVQVVVFVDEFDRFLELEQLEDYRTLSLLRAAFNHDDCQIFVAGFRRVREAALDVKHPLYNFGPREEVRGLAREETIDMISEPMKLLGIDLAGSDLPEAIFRETRGQPELVQIFGQAVVESVELRGSVPETSEVLRDVLGSFLFRDKTYLTFQKNTTPYEKLVCFLVLQRAMKQGRNVEEFEFGPRDMDELLREHGIRLGKAKIELLASNLEAGNVLASVRGGRSVQYEFTVPQLARYCLETDLDWAIRDALMDVEEALDDASALLDLPEDVEEALDDISALPDVPEERG